jgi:hypothetical protein
MFSKRTWVLFAGLVLPLGCAKENIARNEVIRVEFKSSSDCFSGLSQKVASYRDGKMSDGELKGLWSCVDQALSDYQRLTIGDRPDGSYSSASVAQFLTRYFLKERPIGAQQMVGLLELKRIVVGGSASYVTRAELVRLQEFLALLRDATLELNPYAHQLFGAGPAAPDEHQLSLGLSQLNLSALKAAQFLQTTNQSMSFLTLNRLTQDLWAWLKPSATVQPTAILELLPVLKRVLVGGRLDEIQGREWAPIINQISLSYGIYLRGKFALHSDAGSAQQQRGVANILFELSRMLEQALSRRDNRRIEKVEIRQLIDKLKDTQWLPDSISADAVERLWTFLLTRLLNGGQGTGDLTLNEVQRLRSIPLRWVYLLVRIEGSADKEKLFDGLWERFARTRDASEVYQWDTLGRLLFKRHPASWDADSQAKLVWSFMLADWLKRAYGVSADSFTKADLQSIAGEVIPLLQAFGLGQQLDPIRSAAKILREADLFTLASNGNGTLEVTEISRYLAQLASSLAATNIWLKAAQDLCGSASIECVRNAAQSNENVLAPVAVIRPMLNSYLAGAEETALGAAVEGAYSTGDLLQIWMLFQYIEFFLLHFDTSHNHAIELSESMQAFAVIGPQLAALLANMGLPPDDILAFFTFMLKYRETPFTMWGGQVAFNHWRWKRNSWAFSADRGALMDLLRQLSKL